MNADLKSLLRHPVTIVWLLLVGATGLSWWMGNDDGRFGLSVAAISTMLLIVAFIKVRFVLRHFMEVSGAALPLRLVVDAWVVVVCAALITLYHTG